MSSTMLLDLCVQTCKTCRSWRSMSLTVRSFYQRCINTDLIDESDNDL